MRLIHRITLAILTTLLIVVSLVAVSLYVSVERGFSRYIRKLEEARMEPAVRRLETIYARDRSWVAVSKDPGRFGELLARDDAETHPERPPPPPRPDDQPPRPPADQPALRPPPPPDPGRHSVDPLELPRSTTPLASRWLERVGSTPTRRRSRWSWARRPSAGSASVRSPGSTTRSITSI